MSINHHSKRRLKNFQVRKVREALPEYYTGEFPTLVTFLEKYYDFLDSDNGTHAFGDDVRQLFSKKDAREMQRAALQQEDLFSKRFVYYLATFWSGICSVYFFVATFTEVVNEEMADIILGFLLGTVSGTIMNFFFGSSQGSKQKDRK